MLANRTSRWSLGTALLCIVVLAASWFLLISPRRAEAGDVRDQTAQAETQASTLKQHINQLQSQFANLPEQKQQLAAIQQQLPPNADIPALVRDLQALASTAGISLDSIVPGGATVVGASGAAPIATAAAASGSAGTLVSVPMNLTVTGTYFQASLFLKNLQTGLKRSYLINSVALAPGQIETASTAAAFVPTESATAVPTATGTATPIATATAIPTDAVPTASADPGLSQVAMLINGSVFVLLDGSASLAEVTAQAKAAATGKGATATSTASSTSTALPTASATSTPTATSTR